MDNKQQPTLLDNWTVWLQARIPTLKESHNVFWLKQAMEGYKSDSSKIGHTGSVPTSEALDKISRYPEQNIINVHPSNAEAVKEFFDKNKD